MWGYIYEVTNNINGETYVGQHKYEKLELDPYYMGSGMLLRESYKKYGKENFSIRIITFCANQDNMDDLEKWWISYYKQRGKCEYNTAGGGLNGNVFAYMTEEQKFNYSTKRKETWNSKSDQEKQKIKDKMQATRANWSEDFSQQYKKSQSEKSKRVREIKSNQELEDWNKKNSEGVKKYYQSLTDEQREVKRLQCLDASKKAKESRTNWDEERKQQYSKMCSERSKIKKKCPYCDFESNFGNVAKHVKKTHKN